MERFDILLIVVVIAAFVVGYAIVGFVINKIKALNARPPLNEEMRKEDDPTTETQRTQRKE